jgi:hypothetical protein
MDGTHLKLAWIVRLPKSSFLKAVAGLITAVLAGVVGAIVGVVVGLFCIGPLYAFFFPSYAHFHSLRMSLRAAEYGCLLGFATAFLWSGYILLRRYGLLLGKASKPNTFQIKE